MRQQGTQVLATALAAGPVISGNAAKSIAFRDALRLQESFTAPAERKMLAWLAARLPPWVTSDHLTVLGFAAMLLAGASYAFVQVN